MLFPKNIPLFIIFFVNILIVNNKLNPDEKIITKNTQIQKIGNFSSSLDEVYNSISTDNEFIKLHQNLPDKYILIEIYNFLSSRYAYYLFNLSKKSIIEYSLLHTTKTKRLKNNDFKKIELYLNEISDKNNIYYGKKFVVDGSYYYCSIKNNNKIYHFGLTGFKNSLSKNEEEPIKGLVEFNIELLNFLTNLTN